MRRLLVILTLLLLVNSVCVVSASGWEVEYTANSGKLPSASSPAWNKVGGNGVKTTITSGALRINDQSATDYAYYQIEKWTIEAGTPVTMEARLRIASDFDPLNNYWSTVMSIQTKGVHSLLSIYQDHLRTYEYGYGERTYFADFSNYRTIRWAVDAGNKMSTWVDGQLAFSFAIPRSGGQSGLQFGAGSAEGMSDSYWQYVVYSKQFLPVPEPSSILALLAGIAGIGGIAWRRR